MCSKDCQPSTYVEGCPLPLFIILQPYEDETFDQKDSLFNSTQPIAKIIVPSEIYSSETLCIYKIQHIQHTLPSAPSGTKKLKSH